MNNLNPVEIIKDGNNATILFKGKEGLRDDFLATFYTVLLDYFKGTEKSFYKPFLYAFKEIVKNIYDHGIGKATLVMINTPDSFSFDFIDENPAIVNFADVNNPENWKKKSENNFGVGLRHIINICKAGNITLRIDDTKGGIHYHGLYQKTHPV